MRSKHQLLFNTLSFLILQIHQKAHLHFCHRNTYNPKYAAKSSAWRMPCLLTKTGVWIL